jgi:hypothetical protein
MLDVEDAPTLPATATLTYDELYADHLVESSPKPENRIVEIAKYWKSPRSF